MQKRAAARRAPAIPKRDKTIRVAEEIFHATEYPNKRPRFQSRARQKAVGSCRLLACAAPESALELTSYTK